MSGPNNDGNVSRDVHQKKKVHGNFLVRLRCLTLYSTVMLFVATSLAPADLHNLNSFSFNVSVLFISLISVFINISLFGTSLFGRDEKVEGKRQSKRKEEKG